MTTWQYKMLGIIEAHGGLTPEEALTYTQVTFGAVCSETTTHRRWVIFSATKHKFVLSQDGIEAREKNRHLDLHRKHNTGKFSSKVPFRPRAGALKVVSMRTTAA